MNFWKKTANKGVMGNKGFTMIELMFGLAILALSIVGIVGFANMNTSTAGQQEELRNLNAIRAKAKDLYGAAANYTGISNAIITNAGGFPQKMKKGTSVKNVWGGDVTVAVDATDATRFTITYAAVPKENCINLGSADPSSWVTTKVGTNTITSDPATANTACSAATNTLVFTTN